MSSLLRGAGGEGLAFCHHFHRTHPEMFLAYLLIQDMYIRVRLWSHRPSSTTHHPSHHHHGGDNDGIFVLLITPEEVYYS